MKRSTDNIVFVVFMLACIYLFIAVGNRPDPWNLRVAIVLGMLCATVMKVQDLKVDSAMKASARLAEDWEKRYDSAHDRELATFNENTELIAKRKSMVNPIAFIESRTKKPVIDIVENMTYEKAEHVYNLLDEMLCQCVPVSTVCGGTAGLPVHLMQYADATKLNPLVMVELDFTDPSTPMYVSKIFGVSLINPHLGMLRHQSARLKDRLKIYDVAARNDVHSIDPRNLAYGIYLESTRSRASNNKSNGEPRRFKTSGNVTAAEGGRNGQAVKVIAGYVIYTEGDRLKGIAIAQLARFANGGTFAVIINELMNASSRHLALKENGNALQTQD